MRVELRADPSHARKAERRGDDLWVELDAAGEYTDIGTEAENELLDELKAAAWEDVVARRFAVDYPWLYKIITDRGRSLFLDFLPIEQGGSFLDVGSGWGQVAIPLARLGNVFCLDVTLRRLEILREIAKQERAELNYILGNFRTFPFAEQQFDLVVFNGSLEWIALGLDTSIWEAQKAALEKAQHILKPGGLVYVGIENAMGLKYLLGAPDDHTGIPHLTFLDEAEAVATYAKLRGGARLPAKTWSLREYTALIDGAGFESLQVYACFPDYKLIRAMVPIESVNGFLLADAGLPYPEHSGSDGTELPFNGILGPIYRLLARNGVAQHFCPSFGLIAKKPQ